MVASGRRSRFSLMKGVAHLPGLEAPVRFNALLKRLLKAM
jgi:pimeloyl-ACP methyl ester carboxylesterase